ncbi:hypothetical protein BYT27DRAFT_7094651 [Phlegmacium glaucopus]|nr:hypothetical protein BYT27DRAFT_7094651 [Phlegmacium glaucopus]
MVANYIQRPFPLITPHTKFQLAPLPPLPTITPHIEFNIERLAAHSNATLGSLRERRSLGHQHQPELENQSQGSDQEPDRLPPALSQASPPNKIPKPPGEPGRPGSGGFCVETTLVDSHQWTKEAVDDLSDAVRAEARRTLDMTVSFRSQEKKLIEKICEKMVDRWPELDDYDGHWPVRSILKLVLKYGAEASRRATMKETNNCLRSAIA